MLGVLMKFHETMFKKKAAEEFFGGLGRRIGHSLYNIRGASPDVSRISSVSSSYQSRCE